MILMEKLTVLRLMVNLLIFVIMIMGYLYLTYQIYPTQNM